MTGTEEVDVLVVGAGVVGLCHAAAALDRGLSVTVVDRDDRPVGASVQNFGHVSITAQAGQVLDLGRASRAPWIDLARRAQFWLGQTGTVLLARAPDEAALIEEFVAVRGEESRMLGRPELDELVPSYDDAAITAAHLPWDLRVDARTAIPALAAWLERSGVRFRWRTTVTSVANGVVETSRGELRAQQVLICVGHDIDRILPALADELEIGRCRLQMFEVEPVAERPMMPALLSGTSMTRYPGLAACPSASAIRDRLQGEQPGLLEHAINLMVTQRPDGGLVVGDSHHVERSSDPFDDDEVSRLLLTEGAQLLGVPELVVRRHWRGTYASAPGDDVLVRPLDEKTSVVGVTSGIGMTIAPALAARVLDELV